MLEFSVLFLAEIGLYFYAFWLAFFVCLFFLPFSKDLD